MWFYTSYFHMPLNNYGYIHLLITLAMLYGTADVFANFVSGGVCNLLPTGARLDSNKPAAVRVRVNTRAAIRPHTHSHPNTTAQRRERTNKTVVCMRLFDKYTFYCVYVPRVLATSRLSVQRVCVCECTYNASLFDRSLRTGTPLATSRHSVCV